MGRGITRGLPSSLLALCRCLSSAELALRLPPHAESRSKAVLVCYLMEGGDVAVKRRRSWGRRRRTRQQRSEFPLAGKGRRRDRTCSRSPPACKKLSSGGGGGSAAVGVVEDAQPECIDSEDDMFGDYDGSFGDNSFLAEVEDIEQRCIKTTDSIPDFKDLDCNSTVEPVCVENVAHALSTAKTISCSRNPKEYDNLKNMEVLKDSRVTSEEENVECLPFSQLMFLEKSDEDLLDPHKPSSVKASISLVDPGAVKTSDMTYCSDRGNYKKDGEPSTSTLSESSKRRSIKDHLKSAMTDNARVAMPIVSKSKLLKDAAVCEELGVENRNGASFVDIGPFYGLPTKVKELLLQFRGIKNMYDWQHTCLTLESLKQRKNLIFSLPTSGGKTLVAEILIFQELLCKKKDVLMILPYVAIVQEKVGSLSSFGMDLGFLVEEYAGSKGKFPPIKRRLKKSLYVATIEKGHSLVNSLIETGRISDLGLVVVDELHMIGAGSRGAILEMTLTKTLYTSKTTQIIGMSATLSNVEDLQKFLKAEYYTSNFRPVELTEYVKIQDCIYQVDSKAEGGFKFSRLLDFKYSSALQKMDPDHLFALVTEVVPKNSCLVFCPTKKNCENVAEMICKPLNRNYKKIKEKEKRDLIEDLTNSCNGRLCPVLKQTIPFGIAYHHSGLTNDERKRIEEAYSSGTLCLLTCTSTLAAGVNLPARRVILRAPYVAKEFIKKNQYKQMIGRAGRAGIDETGESILIVQEKDKQLVQDLLSSPLESCYSNLLLELNKGIRSLILSVVGLKIATSPEQVYQFMCSTLLSVQPQLLPEEKSLRDVTMEGLEWLKQNGFLKERANKDSEEHNVCILGITPLGQATYKGSVDLAYCDTLYADLKKGLEGLILESCLHLLYLATPYDMISQCSPNWMIYLNQYSQLSPVEQQTAVTVGVMESFVTRKASGQIVKKTLLKENNIWHVAEKFNISRGFVQSLLNSSASFCLSVLHFCEELNEFWVYKALLTELTKRLSYCVKAELIPLMEVPGVLEARARQFYNSGYKTLGHLANANPEVLVKTIDHLSRNQARKIVSSAKMLLTEKAEALQEEVEELLRIPADIP